MADLLLSAGSSTLYQPDALQSFADSAETGALVKVRGKFFSLGSPAGERIFRRIYITVTHAAGASFWVTPIVDGIKRTDLKTYCSRNAPPSNDEERYVFMVPLTQSNPNFPNIVTGVRGSVIGVEVETTDPDTLWHLESVEFGMNPRNEGRGTRVATDS